MLKGRSRLVGWCLKLGEFNYEIEYRSSKAKTISDDQMITNASRRKTMGMGMVSLYQIRVWKKGKKTTPGSETTEVPTFKAVIEEEEEEKLQRNRKNISRNLKNCFSNWNEGKSSTDPKETMTAEVNYKSKHTVYTSYWNLILEMPITERYSKSFEYQIRITLVLHPSARPKTEKTLLN